MVKEIERSGLPVVHVATIVPISKTVGANRIVPAVAIPYPLGNPKLSQEEEYKIRMKLTQKALYSLQVALQEQTVFEDELTTV